MGLGDSSRERQRRKAWLATLTKEEVMDVHDIEIGKLKTHLVNKGFCLERQDGSLWPTKMGERWLSLHAPGVLAAILQREGRL